jgi:hypothetical protein
VNIPESVTFEEAIALTQDLMAQVTGGEISQSEFADAIAQLLSSENGARGFFVTYLTSEGEFADNSSPELLQSLQSAPDSVAELLVKNLAMSSAMAIAHRRNENEEMAQGSDRVRSRSIALIDQLQLPQLPEIAAQLRESAVTGEGNYKSFIQRWEYDAEQREIIRQAMDRVLPKTDG